MVLLAIAALGLHQTTLKASDFFPLVPGTRFTYKQHGKTDSISLDVVQEQVKIGDVMTTPVFTYRDGQLLTKTFYSVSDTSVDIVAYDVLKPLSIAVPLFKFRGSDTSWKFDETPTSGKETYSHIYSEGKATLKGKQDVLKNRVEVIEVKVEAIIGGESGSPEIIKQTSRFAKGIGLISTTSKYTVAKTTDQVDLKLLNVEQSKEK